MPKFMVTVTGADDKTSHEDIIAISKKYPFVEWGILFSATQPGIPRYPSRNWRLALYASMMQAQLPLNISAHLCGRLVEERLDSASYIHTEIETLYPRVQFNKFNKENAEQVLEYSRISGCNVIVPSNATSRASVLGLSEKDHISVLFDSSGGKGLAPNVWPNHLNDFLLCGYAGGINEQNINGILTILGNRYGENPFWIDLESGARDENNEFDIDKVDRILGIAAKHQEERKRIILLS